MRTGTKTRLNDDDYRAIPPDGKRYELIDGDVQVTRAPSPSHQRLVLRLARGLEDQLRPPAEVFVAPVDVILTPHDIVQPDLMVVANPAQVSARGIEGPPLLVVEVLSLTTSVYDRTTKAHRYAVRGIPHYWIVDPETRAVECFRREAGAYQRVGAFGSPETLTHPDFAGLELDRGSLWRS
jgi:Uma2 family endonuclease